MATTIQQFFGALLDGWRRQHVDTVAACFALPCVVASHGDQQLLVDQTQLAAYCQGMVDGFAARGQHVERYTVRSLLLLGDEFAVANVAWSTIGENRSLRTFHTAYNVRRQDGGWAIWAVTSHEAAAD